MLPLARRLSGEANVRSTILGGPLRGPNNQKDPVGGLAADGDPLKGITINLKKFESFYL